MQRAIQAIKQRGESLLSFTERYRALTRVPPPQKEDVNLLELVDRICTLHEAEFKKNSIKLIKRFPKHKVVIDADPGLIEQAFINLIKNGIEALEARSNSTIEILVYKDNRSTIIQIADNGEGIEKGMIDKIFVPFFTMVYFCQRHNQFVFITQSSRCLESTLSLWLYCFSDFILSPSYNLLINSSRIKEVSILHHIINWSITTGM